MGFLMADRYVFDDKSPGDEWPHKLDFSKVDGESRVLPEDDRIVWAKVDCQPNDLIAEGSIIDEEGTSVTTILKGGSPLSATEPRVYRVIYRVVTQAGHKLERSAMIKVRER